MSDIITAGLDLAKNVYQVHGSDCAGRAVLRKNLRRTGLVAQINGRIALVNDWLRSEFSQDESD